MQWLDVFGAEAPQPIERGETTVYFRRAPEQTEGGWHWREAQAPVAQAAAAAQEAIADLLTDMAAADFELVKALLPTAAPAQLVSLYDHALEAWLKAQRERRGYTLREPSGYPGSPVVRYAQDLEDWELYKGRAMIYGLTKLNEYASTGAIPAFDDFIAGLGTVSWTIDPDCANPSEGMIIPFAVLGQE